MKYSLCIEPVLPDMEPLDRIAVAAEIGYDAVEFWNPARIDAEEAVRRAARCGIEVARALEAAEALSAEGIALRVVNVSTIKPLDREGVRKYASDVKAVMTAEEHSVIGGLGSAICEALSEARVPVRIMGIQDAFGRSAAAYDELMAKYGLTADAIVSNVRDLLK